MNKRFTVDRNVRDRMPLVNKVVDKYRGTKPLSIVTVLLIQHQLENHYAQASALLELGADPKKIHWIDIPYSSHPEVREALYELKIPRKNFVTSHDYRLTMNYAGYQRARVQKWIRKYLNVLPDGERLLVLDDGAYFLEGACCFRQKFPALAAVEQTARGLRKINNNAAMRHYSKRIPVIKVADSNPKKELEPHYIGKSVCEALQETLSGHENDVKGGRCLILGFGSIGEAVTDWLVNIFRVRREYVHVFDPDNNRMKKALSDGYSEWVRCDYHTRFKLVIGCSGEQSFSLGDHVYLEDEAYLVSASSGAHEVNREAFVDLADSSDIDDVSIVDREKLDDMPVHSDISIELVGQSATFLNGGFPINFDGKSINRIRAEDIQVTVAMMLMGAIQAVKTDRKGLIELAPTFCKWLMREFQGKRVTLSSSLT